MRQLSSAGQQIINDIAQRNGFSVEATLSMLDSVINGNGNQAQFNHPEFSGAGQWMRGGMIMLSDMFNNYLKGRVDNLCNDLSSLVVSQPDLVRSGSFQSQSQGDGHSSGQVQTSHGDGGQQQGADNLGPASLFVPGTTNDWWPSDLRFPNSTGAQNGVRYAYFAQARRLVIEVAGRVTVYDTLDHRIGGFGQQQSYDGSLSFNSQYGLIDVASLPVISDNGLMPNAALPLPASNQAGIAQPLASDGPRNASTGNSQEVLAIIEKLADLRCKGVISDDEFASKKAELLKRL
ncbi:SHOCT domain-containing protein [Variovorax robiniae]|uniref:SHOCT domain-containing protein n=1 Tax=Variovorax robiniae TaxID=1836199 RepID=A0ABU8XKI7_9BURK